MSWMSKAFTREDDEADDESRTELLSTPVEPHYITRDGIDRMSTELARLKQEYEETASSGSGHQAIGLERRIKGLEQRIACARVIESPLSGEEDRVRFGAFVTVEEQDTSAVDYRIVGTEETDPARNWISPFSPLGRALLNKKVGDEVRVELPVGETSCRIVRISSERPRRDESGRLCDR